MWKSDVTVPRFLRRAGYGLRVSRSSLFSFLRQHHLATTTPRHLSSITLTTPTPIPRRLSLPSDQVPPTRTKQRKKAKLGKRRIDIPSLLQHHHHPAPHSPPACFSPLQRPRSLPHSSTTSCYRQALSSPAASPPLPPPVHAP